MPTSFEIADTPNNRKVLYVLLRLLKLENGKNLFTFRIISKIFNLNNRQDSNNFFREFLACDEDLLSYLERKIKLGDAFPLIEKQVLDMPLLSISEQYKIFSENHPEFKMSYTTFQKYFSRIDSKKLKKRYDELITDKKCQVDRNRILKELLSNDDISNHVRKKILSVLPEIEPSEKEVRNEVNFIKDWTGFGKYYLVMFLIASNMAYDSVATLLNVSKSTIHNWFYKLSFMKKYILSSITFWSGIICADEKWVLINGTWYYILSIVDNQTGFLLYFTVVSDLTAETWKIFFQRFYHLYGIPKLIISDGSKSLAAGMKVVFGDVPHQLCKFHKLKNLIKIINIHYKYSSKRTKMIRLARNIFSNSTHFGRKRAARKLIKNSHPNVAKYIENNILGQWEKMTKSYTSNAVERWNRMIEKVFAKRYGLKSVQFVELLITALWFKVALSDKMHIEKGILKKINISQECQEHLKMSYFKSPVKRKLLKKGA